MPRKEDRDRPAIEVTEAMCQEGAEAMAEAGLFGTDCVAGLDWDGWKATAKDVFLRMTDIASQEQARIL
jgi:hypothetical protein